MKTFSEYTNSKKCSIRESAAPQYTLFPKDQDELERMIRNELNTHGNKADLNHIDLSKIGNLSGLFRYTSFNGDISKWDVSNVMNMSGMFQNSSFCERYEWDVLSKCI